MFKKYKNTAKKNKLEICALVTILIIAAILAVLQPWNPDFIAYFSDVTTPMIIFVGLILILLAGKRVV